ncbi:LysR family glycine cleavage system transcriptional activator [Angulomicrobium tetraedrale]|uniref:LysR family glycine cleavage system transcriptional activator n=1 Tax=Ancylobacter tetraedralis TaxID=217068 RepID=A0A839Z862_9HYPH|nr:LysR substrate-binding domain-containing protein [Ancylobacter tetraedralis]MBB3771393.1 LysR family glycine cleavage system transcriptional activator [Ancylobacter tetraedralis]
MRRLPPLGSLRAFEAAARLESFKLAAAELGVTPTAVSHQIRRLEADLGLALFVRQTRKVALTPQGQALLVPMRTAFDSMAEAIDDLIEEARPHPRRHVATLSATAAFAARLLVPRVAGFRARHPDWDLRLHASDEPVDVAAGEADVAIRYGRGSYPGLTALPLIADGFAPVCAASLPLRRPEDLARATLIHIEQLPWTREASVPSWEDWRQRAGLASLDIGAGISFNDEASAIQAVIAGHGVALLSLVMIAPELAGGTLVQPFGPVIAGLSYHLVFARAAANQPAVAMLRRWVVEEFAAAPSAARITPTGS